jgi:hypothetical protein
VPIADIVKALVVKPVDFFLFGAPIRPIGSAASFVGSPRSSRRFDRYFALSEAREQLTPGFGVRPPYLSVGLEVRQNIIGQNQHLERVSDRVSQHG